MNSPTPSPSVDKSIQELRKDGWIPNRLVCSYDGTLAEVISYPFPSDDGKSVLIHARATPGDATTSRLWILKGETDSHATGPRDLRITPAVCPNCKRKWKPKCEGELRDCHVDCPSCLRTYTATFGPGGGFDGFRFHEAPLTVTVKKWANGRTS